MEKHEKQELPANIYKMYDAYENETSTTRKMELILDVFKQTVQFFGCLFLSEYLWDEEKVNSTVNGYIRQMGRPALGTWDGLVRSYAKEFCRKKKSWFQGFWDCYKSVSEKKVSCVYVGRFREENSEKGNVFQELIMLRNQIAHGAQYPNSEEASAILKVYAPYVEAILHAFVPFFTRYKVAKCINIDTYDEELDEDCYIATFDIFNYSIKENDNYVVRWPMDTEELGDNPSEFFKGDEDRSPEEEGVQFYLLDMENTQRILKFSEILVEILESDIHEEYMIYDGYGNSDVTYVGVRERRKLKLYLQAINAKFTSRGIRQHWMHHDFNMDGFRQYINELSQIAIDNHKESLKYVPDLYVPRACDETIKEFLNSDKTTVLIKAEAGAGKTCFLCHTAEMLMSDRERYAVYFYQGETLTEVNREDILFRRLEQECLEKGDFLSSENFLSFIAEHNEENIQLVMIVDAVNEAYDTERVLKEIDAITSRGKDYPWLKIIVSIRGISYDLLQKHTVNKGKKFQFMTSRDRFFSVVEDGEPKYYLGIDRWNLLQVEAAYDRYRSKSKRKLSIPKFRMIDNELKQVLSSPLSMRVFFDLTELVKGISIHSDSDLFAAFDKEISKGDEVISNNPDFVTSTLKNCIVEAMLEEKSNAIDSDRIEKISDGLIKKADDDYRFVILTPLERLLDAGIVCEKESLIDNTSFRSISFVYQKYLEYLICRRIDKEKPLEQVADELIETIGWEELPEAFLAYCSALDRYKNCAEVVDLVVGKLREKEQNLEAFKAVLIPYCVRRFIENESEDDYDMMTQLIKVLEKYELVEWGVDIVESFRHMVESDLANKFADVILESKAINCELKSKVLFHKSMICQNRSQYQESISLLEKAKDGELSEALNNQIIVQLAKNQRKNGSVQEAETLLEKMIGESSDDTPFYPYALIQRGLCSVERNNYDTALDDYEKALDISRTQHDYHTVAYNLLGISHVYKQRGDSENVRKSLMEVYELSSRYGYLDLLSDCLHALAGLYVDEGKYEDAEKYTDQTIALWESSGHYEGLSIMYIMRGIVLTKKGKNKYSDDIKAAVDRAEELHEFIKNDAVEREYQKYKSML